jgi:hypothetical protein
VVHLGELYCEFRETRITEDSKSSTKWALSRCKECTEGDRTGGSSGRRHSTRRALRQCADRHREKEDRTTERCRIRYSTRWALE